MKFSCSYTDAIGLTVSLDVSAPTSFFEPSISTSESLSLDRDLASSAFAQAIPKLSNRLLEVYSAAYSDLHASYCEVLSEKVADEENGQVSEIWPERAAAQPTRRVSNG